VEVIRDFGEFRHRFNQVIAIETQRFSNVADDPLRGSILEFDVVQSFQKILPIGRYRTHGHIMFFPNIGNEACRGLFWAPRQTS